MHCVYRAYDLQHSENKTENLSGNSELGLLLDLVDFYCWIGRFRDVIGIRLILIPRFYFDHT